MGVKQVSADGAVAPNLVPMVDIMFLLLLFFMLGADMGQRELEEVVLPIAETVQVEKPEDTGLSQRLTINVYHCEDKCTGYLQTQFCSLDAHWCIGIRGRDFRDPAELKTYLQAEVTLEREKHPEQDPKLSSLRVSIRADRSAPYGQVQKAMNGCAEVGIYKTEIGAAAALE